MARTYSPRVRAILALVAARPSSFADIHASLPETDRAGLPQLICRMAEARILRPLKRLRRAPDGKNRFVYVLGDVSVVHYRGERARREPRPMATLASGGPRVSMQAFSALCKAFRVALPAFVPAPATVRVVRGIDRMRPNRDVAQHALPVARFTVPVSEFSVMR